QVDDDRMGKQIKKGSWMLFNDVAVTASSCPDALDFTSRFRAPAVVIYKKRIDDTLLPKPPAPYRVNPDVFLTPSITAAAKKQHRHGTASNLSMPTVKEGDLISIDCEFVALTNDVYDVKPDGTKIVTSP